MYKKVTHNIIEEHFAHPAAAEIKAALVSAYDRPVGGYDSYAAKKFKKDATHGLAKYFWRIRSYLVSVFDNAEDQSALEMQLFSDIAAIGDVVKGYYGESASSTFVQLVKTMSLSAIDVIKAIKLGVDPRELRAKCIVNINDFANFLNSANQASWPAAAVSSLFTQLLDSWIEQAVARMQKNWQADFAASDAASTIFMGGRSTDAKGFTDIFVDGVLKQFPERFVD